MYLKEVEVNGFKSFADKISFKFNKGITAIVGPNGSGKSNVVDAVRWVLGEQSVKQLRGERMEDVIFAGTMHRKSQGYAYVSLTIDNKDKLLNIEYEEIKVSRKLYRSGDSEYRINDNLCRLKDIHEIFYDTGVGKEGYSIIGQGQIDKILSGKSDKRRELIDEAIGIVKFKKRKQEALKKLDGEEVNLVRILDILLELENQLKPLESQAKKAKDYLIYKEELKGYEIFDFVNKYSILKEKLIKFEKDIDDCSSLLNRLEEKREASRLSHIKVDEAFAKLELEINDINELIKNKLNEMSEIGSDEKLLNQEIEYLIKTIDSQELKIDYLRKQLNIENIDNEDNEEKIKELTIIKNEVALKLNPLENEIESLKNKLNFNIDNISQKREKLSKLLSIEKELSSEQSYNKAVCEQFATKKNDIEVDKLSLEKEIDFIEIELNKESIKYDSEKKEERRLTEEKDELRSSIDNSSTNIKKLRQDIISFEAVLSKASSQLTLLENMATRYEGYGQAIKKVMDAFSNNEDNLGVVADLINVDKSYEVAIETALGGALQNIVTKNTFCAKAMIDSLRKNKWGRATFLPLDNIKARGTLRGDAVIEADGIIDVAVNLVALPKGFEGLGDYLLGSTLVAKDIDSAIKLNKNSKGYKIVTLSGELLMPTGSMSGGSFRTSFNLLSRSREIEDLKLKIKKITNELKIKNQCLDSTVSDHNMLENKLNSVYDSREILRLTLAKRSENKANLNSLLQKNKTELETLNSSFDVHISSYEESNRRLEDFRYRLDKVIDERGSLSNNIGLLETDIAAINKELEKRKEDAKILEGKFVSNNQLLNFAIETKKRLGIQIDDKENEISQISKAIMESKEELSLKKVSAIDSSERYEKLVGEHSILISKSKELDKKNKDLIENNKAIFSEREALNEEVLTIEKKKLVLESGYENTDKKFTTLVEYMFDEYSLTYSEAKEVNKLNPEGIDIKSNIDSLKRKIRTMGSINVNAVEEYRTLKERHDFLEKQKNDILESKEKLMGVISSLDEGMVEQFSSKFTLLEKSFSEIFVQLFGGGRVDMQLVEPNNILESGIEINAQPPGKKLQNMLQLSGGEKALTAISLMFAIQSLNPSPFCFLDEIEAALDDTNVVRFSSYLSNLTTNTQFIVITHRKGTMQSADRLYGVTMQEKGVSTLVSVEMVGI